MRYENPVIPGFYPDPSACRVGERYYLAASSFQYFPGVPLFESDDLVNWRLVGHALTRSRSPWGPFENCPRNPILTNRDRAPAVIQGIGHGDLVRAVDGSWQMLSLGFRQIHPWQPYHTLGREVFLTPVRFDGDGWPVCGRDGTTEASYELPGDFAQRRKLRYTFADTRPGLDWVWLRRPAMENYDFTSEKLTLRGTWVTLSDVGSPTFLALRQRGFDFELRVDVSVHGPGCVGGVTIYMSKLEHYDMAEFEDFELEYRWNSFKSLSKKLRLTGFDDLCIIGNVGATADVKSAEAVKATPYKRGGQQANEFFVRCK